MFIFISKIFLIFFFNLRPPELFTGVNYYSTEIDMWSVGCILAELLSKKILFQCNSASQQVSYTNVKST